MLGSENLILCRALPPFLVDECASSNNNSGQKWTSSCVIDINPTLDEKQVTTVVITFAPNVSKESNTRVLQKLVNFRIKIDTSKDFGQKIYILKPPRERIAKSPHN